MPSRTGIIVSFAVLSGLATFLWLNQQKQALPYQTIRLANSDDDDHKPGRISEPQKMMKEKKPKHRLPDVLIIGIKKGGTSTLNAMLPAHPTIKSNRAEACYFGANYEKGKDWYINRLPMARETDILMEKCPGYFVKPSALEKIYNEYQSKPVKFILIVRNPIDRMVSDYLHVINIHNISLPDFKDLVLDSNGAVTLSNDQWTIFHKSLYDEHYARWLEVFDKSQILVLDGDRFKSEPVAILKQVEEFLGVKSYFTQDMFFTGDRGLPCWKDQNSDSGNTCMIPTKGRPHPKLDEDLTRKLNEFLNPHMQRFCQLAAVNFPWCILA